MHNKCSRKARGEEERIVVVFALELGGGSIYGLQSTPVQQLSLGSCQQTICCTHREDLEIWKLSDYESVRVWINQNKKEIKR